MSGASGVASFGGCALCRHHGAVVTRDPWSSMCEGGHSASLLHPASALERAGSTPFVPSILLVVCTLMLLSVTNWVFWVDPKNALRMTNIFLCFLASVCPPRRVVPAMRKAAVWKLNSFPPSDAVPERAVSCSVVRDWLIAAIGSCYTVHLAVLRLSDCPPLSAVHLRQMGSPG